MSYTPPATRAPMVAPRRHRAFVVLGALALMAGCGGGTSQYDPFVPQRIFAFGDETSALTSDGRNYGINGLKDVNTTPDDTSDDVFDCTLAPNWVQALASSFGLVFPECNPSNVTEPQGRNLAAPGARVKDIAAQVEAARVKAGGFRDKDLVALMVGTHDIIDLYKSYIPGTDTAPLVAEARERGVRTAQAVNGLIAAGAKVVIANLPDLGASPYALAEKAKPENQDTDRAALITRLAAAFNEQLGVNILLDGRFVGLVQFDQRSQVIARSPAAVGFGNASDSACTAAPPACTSNTLVDAAKTSTYFWAWDYWVSAAGQVQLASMAIDRAHRNPF